MRLLFIFSLIAAVLGSSITNGTCYWRAGDEADAIYSPCGNTIDGNWPCCQLGDKCNDHNTCTWSNGHDPIYTYVAGCTDPNYEDESCPLKGNFSNYQWVGLAWTGCGTSGPIVDWYGCKNDGYPRVRVSTESANCVCDEVDQPLLEQVPTGLVAMGYLPLSKMGEISWQPGWERTDPVVSGTATATTSSSVSTRTLAPPTTRDSTTITPSSSTTASSTATSSTTQTTSVANAAATNGSINDSDSSSGLSTGSKVGLGIGIPLLGLAACAFLIIAYRFHKNRKQHRQESVNEQIPQDQEKNIPTPPAEPAMLDAESTQRDSAWSGEKSELPGSPPNPSLIGTVSPINTDPMQNEGHTILYKPFQYQSAGMVGNPQLTQNKRLNWAGVDYATYRAGQVGNEGYGHVSHGGRDHQGGVAGAHELPG